MDISLFETYLKLTWDDDGTELSVYARFTTPEHYFAGQATH